MSTSLKCIDECTRSSLSVQSDLADSREGERARSAHPHERTRDPLIDHPRPALPRCGTDGIITLENLVECLIGEIHDEYDGHESAPVVQPRTGDIEVDGLISLEDLQESTGISLPEGPYETVSGFVMHYLGRIAQVNDVVRINGARFTIISMNGKRVGQLLLARDDVK